MIDSKLLKLAMIKADYTVESLANDINISRATLIYKINNEREFKSSEIKALIHCLSLSEAETFSIFFN